MEKVISVKGTFDEVYTGALAVFDGFSGPNLPDAKYVKEALVLGHYGALQSWYEWALQEVSDPDWDVVSMTIDESARRITFVAPIDRVDVEDTVITVYFDNGVLYTTVEFDRSRGSVKQAGELIRAIKYHNQLTSAVYTVKDGGTYQVAFVELSFVDIIFFKRRENFELNNMWQNTKKDLFPPNWPAITAVTMEEYNRLILPHVLNLEGHEERVKRILSGETTA